MNAGRLASVALAIACIGPGALAWAQDTVAMERIGLINELFLTWGEAPIQDEHVLGWKPLDDVIEGALARLDGQDAARAYHPPGVSYRDMSDVPIAELRAAAARIVREADPLLDRLAAGLSGPVDGLDHIAATWWDGEYCHYYRCRELGQLVLLAGVSAADRGDLREAGKRYRLALRLAAEVDASELIIGVRVAGEIQARVFPHLLRWITEATPDECGRLISELADCMRTRTSTDRLIEADMTMWRLEVPSIVAGCLEQGGPAFEAYFALPAQAALRTRLHARMLLVLHLANDSLLRAWRRGGWDAAGEQAGAMARAMEAHTTGHSIKVVAWTKLAAELLAAGRPVDLAATVDWDQYSEYVSYRSAASVMGVWDGASRWIPSGLARLRLLRLAAALRLYHLEHQAYPDRLDALGASLGKDALLDPFAREPRPLRYEARDGGFRLWSIGPDRCDQGGWDVLRYEEDAEPGDIVVTGDLR